MQKHAKMQKYIQNKGQAWRRRRQHRSCGGGMAKRLVRLAHLFL
jgi:hypothetical protein